MLIVLVCFNLILAYSFVVLFLTFPLQLSCSARPNWACKHPLFAHQVTNWVQTILHWIGQDYTYIPILQARIKALTALNDSLANANRELKANAQRQAKRLKRTGNIIIKNTDNVKAVINSEIL
jgi:hypothetical protein